ncbi:receptor-interacting serine/threonine-protein kinase 1-like isoform X1 [Glandiceps talaboti]
MNQSRPEPEPERLYTFKVTSSEKLTGKTFLAAGSFGAVHKSCHEDWGDVAVKTMFDNVRIMDREHKELVAEAKKMAEARHRNIVLLYGVIMEPRSYSLVVEFMQYGSLQKFQTRFDNPWPIRTRMIRDIILAMNYLATTLNIIHRDLKIDNVLVGQGFIAKVSDFGLSVWKKYTRKYRRKKRSQSQEVAGTISHIAPESLLDINRKPDSLFDVYSFAITLWEIITEASPYDHAHNSAQICVAITTGQRPDMARVLPECPDFVKTMMLDCWNGTPEDRPSFGDLKVRIEKEMENVREIDITNAEIDLQEQIKNQYECEQRVSDGGSVIRQEEEQAEGVSKVTRQPDKTGIAECSARFDDLVLEDIELRTSSELDKDHRNKQETGTPNKGSDNNLPVSDPYSSTKYKTETVDVTSSDDAFPLTETHSPGIHPHKVTSEPTEAEYTGRTLDNQQDLPPGGKYTPTQGGVYYIAPGHQPIFLRTEHTTVPEHTAEGDASKIINISANNSSIQIGDGNTMYISSASTDKLPSKAPRKIKISTSTTPVMLEDLEAVSEHVGHAFRRLGRKLGFSNGQVDCFDHDCNKLNDKNYQLLRKWKERQGSSATRGELAKILFDLKMYEVAELLPYD